MIAEFIVVCLFAEPPPNGGEWESLGKRLLPGYNTRNSLAIPSLFAFWLFSRPYGAVSFAVIVVGGSPRTKLNRNNCEELCGIKFFPKILHVLRIEGIRLVVVIINRTSFVLIFPTSAS